MTTHSPTTRARRRRSISRPVRVLAWSFGTLLALYVAVVSVMSTAWFHHLLVRRVTVLLERVTGARVEMGEMIVRPFTFHVIFRYLVLHGTEAPGGPPLFSARTLVVGINPSTILERRLRLLSLAGQGIDIHIVTYADGSTNLPGPVVARPPQTVLDGFLDVAIRRLTLIETNFYWNDRRIPLNLSARNLALLLDRHPGPRYLGVLSVSDLGLADSRWSLPRLTLSTRLEMSRGRVDLTSIAWRARGASGSGSIRINPITPLSVRFALRADGDMREVARIAKLPPLRSGAFHAASTGTYQGAELTADGHLRLTELRLRLPSFEPGPLRFAADYTLDHRQARIPRWELASFGGSAAGQAQVDLAGPAPRFRLDARLRDWDLAQALRSVPAGKSVLNIVPLSARLRGTATANWTGNLRNLRSQFDLTFEPSSGGRAVTGTARGQATLIRGVPAVELKLAQLRTPHSSIAARGAIAPAAVHLNVQFETSDFEEWRAAAESFAETSLPLRLASTLKFSGIAAGTLSHPQIRGGLSVDRFQYRRWQWNHFEANIDASADRVTISSGILLGGSSAFNFDFSASLDHWKFSPNSSVEMTAAARQTPLEGLEQALGLNYPVSGRISGRLSVSGNHQNLGGSGQFRIEPANLAGESFDWGAAKVRVSHSTWQIEGIELAKGQGRLSGRAVINLPQRSFSAELHGAGFSLADFQMLRRSGPRSAGPSGRTGLGGDLSLEVKGEGTLDEPRLQSALTVHHLRVGTAVLGEFTGEVDGAERVLHVQGVLAGPAGTLHVHGDVKAQGDWPADLKADYTNVRLEPWSRYLGLATLGSQVTLTGSASLNGPLRRPRELRLESRNPGLQVSLPGLVWQNDRPVEIALDHATLTVHPFGLKGPATEFQIQGSMQLAPPSALNLTARGQIDATLLTALDPSLLTAGRFGVELRAAGTPQEPLLYGTVQVEGVSLGYPGFPFRLAGMEGQIRLDGDRLTISSLRAVSGQSSIQATGFAVLSGTPHYDLNISLDRSRVEYPLDFTSLLSGNLHLAGSTQAGVLEGGLVLQRMFVSENFNLLTWLGNLMNQPPAVAAPSSSLASRIRLDVQVATQPQVSIESPDFALTADVDLSLRGTAADPVAFGSVHIERGQVRLRSNTYTLTRGDIILANPLRTQPVLDLEAQTRVQQYDLTLSITGPADRPRLAYRSSPPLSTPDILGLLALGYTRQQEELSATGRSNFSTLGASALLSQALSSQVSGRLQRLFGLSRIAIDPNPSGAGGARVTVQEQLAHDFTITYVNTTGGLQQRIIQVEWALSDRVSIVGIRDQNGVFGLELDLRHRFR